MSSRGRYMFCVGVLMLLVGFSLMVVAKNAAPVKDVVGDCFDSRGGVIIGVSCVHEVVGSVDRLSMVVGAIGFVAGALVMVFYTNDVLNWVFDD